MNFHEKKFYLKALLDMGNLNPLIGLVGSVPDGSR